MNPFARVGYKVYVLFCLGPGIYWLEYFDAKANESGRVLVAMDCVIAFSNRKQRLG
jgi:hypothetical protein